MKVSAVALGQLYPRTPSPSLYTYFSLAQNRFVVAFGRARLQFSLSDAFFILAALESFVHALELSRQTHIVLCLKYRPGLFLSCVQQHFENRNKTDIKYADSDIKWACLEAWPCTTVHCIIESYLVLLQNYTALQFACFPKAKTTTKISGPTTVFNLISQRLKIAALLYFCSRLQELHC